MENKHPTNRILTGTELAVKTKNMRNSYTAAEKREAKLVEVLSYLVALRDHHRHELTIDEAIAKLSGHQKTPIAEVRDFLIARRDGKQCWHNVFDAIDKIKGELDS